MMFLQGSAECRLSPLSLAVEVAGTAAGCKRERRKIYENAGHVPAVNSVSFVVSRKIQHGKYAKIHLYVTDFGLDKRGTAGNHLRLWVGG